MCILAALSIKCADNRRECDKKRRQYAWSVISPSTGVDPLSGIRTHKDDAPFHGALPMLG